MRTIAVTGHRPPKLGGYSPKSERALLLFAEQQLESYRTDKIITGMALGWDQAIAEACVNLKIPYIAAIPFENQESVWPPKSQQKYTVLVEHAESYGIVSEGEYTSAKMQIRNQWMVDHCDSVLALWDGSSGGTCNCIKYAQKVNKPIINVWDKWLEYVKNQKA